MGTWIEILVCPTKSGKSSIVVPYVGTWIEMICLLLLKLLSMVVPYVGTWIEMFGYRSSGSNPAVVPYVGTWIEILCRND